MRIPCRVPDERSNVVEIATGPQLYRGADTCDLKPDWQCHPDDRDLLGMLNACHASDPDDLTPQLALADLLAERDDPRDQWVRVGCELWGQCGELQPSGETWDYEQAKTALTPACQTITGWRVAGLWGCLVGWHAPSSYGGRMGRTWVDERVRVASRLCWWWSLGFLQTTPQGEWRQADAAVSQANAARSQAYAAWNQANAAGSQANNAAGRQAYAAWNQANAAGSQAYAAGSQANAAGRQAYAARSQAYAAWSQANNAAGRQANAAWRQAYAAWSQAWQFIRATWEMCQSVLPNWR